MHKISDYKPNCRFVNNFSAGDYSAHSGIHQLKVHGQCMSMYFSMATLFVYVWALSPRAVFRICTSDVSIQLSDFPLHCCLIAVLSFRALLGCPAHYIPETSLMRCRGLQKKTPKTPVWAGGADLSLWPKSWWKWFFDCVVFSDDGAFKETLNPVNMNRILCDNYHVLTSTENTFV